MKFFFCGIPKIANSGADVRKKHWFTALVDER